MLLQVEVPPKPCTDKYQPPNLNVCLAGYIKEEPQTTGPGHGTTNPSFQHRFGPYLLSVDSLTVPFSSWVTAKNSDARSSPLPAI